MTDASRPPRCGFEAWFGQPEATASKQRFRLYPRVAEVESEVAARSETLARRTKPLSHIIPTRSRRYALLDDLLFASSHPVNPSFAQLAGARAAGSRRWGSITYSEMERLERLFRNQLEVTSSSLCLMSGILAMLKRDNFQPSDPTLFNSALSSVSVSLSRQAHSASAGSAFIRAKRRESLLSHTTLPVPEGQRRSLTVAPGSSEGLFNEDILAEVVAQVQRSSLISSNLAVSRSLSRGQTPRTSGVVLIWVPTSLPAFCDNVTAVAYLRKEGGTRSPLLNTIAQEILHWSESLAIRLAPQFIPGSNNVLADALSRPHQLPHSEWSLNMTVFRSLCRLWPVQIDLFATSANHRCSIYFSPYRDPQSAGIDAFLQSWDGLQAYAFPPFAIILRVLAKLRESRGTELTLVAPHWAQRPWFPDLLQLSLAHPVILPDRLDLLLLPHSRLRYPGLHRLRLHAWRLSGGSPGVRDSPLQ